MYNTNIHNIAGVYVRMYQVKCQRYFLRYWTKIALAVNESQTKYVLSTSSRELFNNSKALHATCYPYASL